jgi:hypothetical protein
MEKFVLVFYVLWFVLILLRQFRGPALRFIKRRDIFYLVPDFRLFAGLPAWDYSFAMRFAFEGGRLGEWVPVEFPHRPTLAALWHPELLERVVAAAIGGHMVRAQTDEERTRLERWYLYRSFLRHLALTATPDVDLVQFKVLKHRVHCPHHSNDATFVSAFHPIRHCLG